MESVRGRKRRTRRESSLVKVAKRRHVQRVLSTFSPESIYLRKGVFLLAVCPRCLGLAVGWVYSSSFLSATLNPKTSSNRSPLWRMVICSSDTSWLPRVMITSRFSSLTQRMVPICSERDSSSAIASLRIAAILATAIRSFLSRVE